MCARPTGPAPHPITGTRPLLTWNDFLRCVFAPDGSPSLLDPALSGVLDIAAGVLDERQDRGRRVVGG